MLIEIMCFHPFKERFYRKLSAGIYTGKWCREFLWLFYKRHKTTHNV